jgi:hypothetical protein
MTLPAKPEDSYQNVEQPRKLKGQTANYPSLLLHRGPFQRFVMQPGFSR